MAEHRSPEATAPPSPEEKEVLVERRERWSLNVSKLEAISSVEEDPALHIEGGLMMSGEATADTRSDAVAMLQNVEMSPPDEVEMLSRWALNSAPSADALAKVFIDETGQPHAVGRVKPGSNELFFAVRVDGSEEPPRPRPLPVNENGLMSTPLEEGEALVMAGGDKGERQAALTVGSKDSHPETNDEIKDSIARQEYIIDRRRKEIAVAAERREEEARRRSDETEEARLRSSKASEPKETKSPTKELKELTPEQKEAQENLESTREHLAKLSADKANRATDIFWTKKKEAEYQEALKEYNEAVSRAGHSGLQRLEEGNYVTEDDTKKNWAVLYKVGEQRELRRLINQNREDLESGKFKNFFHSEGGLGKLAVGMVVGGTVRRAWTTAFGPAGWITGATLGAAVGAGMGAASGRHEGIQSGIRATDLDAEGEATSRALHRLREADENTILKQASNATEIIEKERERVWNATKRGMGRGALWGAGGGLLGVAAADYLMGGDSSATSPETSDAVPESVPEPEVVEPRELSGRELLEMHANDAEAARDIVLDEGPYNTFQEMGIPEDKWEELHRNKGLMEDLIAHGDAYSLAESGDQSYGWGLAHANELSDATIKDIYEAAGMQTTEAADVAGGGETSEGTVTETEARERVDEITQKDNQEIASSWLEASGLEVSSNSSLMPEMIDYIANVDGSGLELNNDGSLARLGEMTPAAQTEITEYLSNQGVELENTLGEYSSEVDAVDALADTMAERSEQFSSFDFDKNQIDAIIDEMEDQFDNNVVWNGREFIISDSVTTQQIDTFINDLSDNGLLLDRVER